MLANYKGGSLPGSVTLLLGNGEGTFGPAVHYAAGRQPDSLAVGDFNGDGIPDVVVGNIDVTASVLLGKTGGILDRPRPIPLGSDPGFITVGDFNGDQKLDIVASLLEGANKVAVALGNGNGTFQPATKYPILVPGGIGVGDFDKNGTADLAVTISNDFRVSVLLGNGDGTFGQLSTYRTNGGYGTVLATDLNGDGYLDLVVTAPMENVISVLMGTGP